MIMPGRVLKVKILVIHRIHCLDAHEDTGQDCPCYFMAEFTEKSKVPPHYTMFTFLVASQRGMCCLLVTGPVSMSC